MYIKFAFTINGFLFCSAYFEPGNLSDFLEIGSNSSIYLHSKSEMIFQEMKKALEDDRQSISQLQSASKELLRRSSEASENRSVTEHCRNISKRREDADRAVSNQISSLEKQIQKAKEFYRVNEMIEEWIPKAEELLCEKEPALKEPDAIKGQIKVLEVIPAFGTLQDHSVFIFAIP